MSKIHEMCRCKSYLVNHCMISCHLSFKCAQVIINRGFLGGSDGKESEYNAEDPGFIPGSGRSPGERNGYPLQYSFWEILWTEEPGWLQSMESQSVGQNWMTNSFSFTMGNSMEIPQSITNRTTIRSTNSTSGYLFKGNKTLTPKGIYTPMFTAPLFITTEQENNLNVHQ